MHVKLVLVLAAFLALMGCQHSSSTRESGTRLPESHALDQWVGTEVTIQFRRDLLGAAGSPIAPNTTWLNGTKVSLDGLIVSVHESGVLFDCHYKMNSGDTELRHSEFWIPNDSILAIEKKL